MQDKNARIHRKRLREFNEIKEEQLSRFCITFVPKSKLHSAILKANFHCARLHRLCTQVKNSTLNSYSYLLEII